MKQISRTHDFLIQGEWSLDPLLNVAHVLLLFLKSGFEMLSQSLCFKVACCLSVLLFFGQHGVFAADDVQKGTRTEASKQEAANEKSLRDKKALEQADSVLAFVGEHQPRLLKLMKYLEKNQPAQYEQAIREMGRSKTRLETFKKRDEKMYAIELELWQLRSEQRLIAAELATQKKAAKRKAGEEALERLVVRESEKNVERLKLLHQKALDQVQRLEVQIEKSEAGQETWVAKQLKTWRNRIQKQVSQASAPSKDGRNKTKAASRAEKSGKPSGSQSDDSAGPGK